MPFDANDPRLTAYALDELDGDDRDAVEVLLAEDAEARQFVNDVRATARLLTEHLQHEPAPCLTMQHKEAIEAEIATAPLAVVGSVRQTRWVEVLSVAAGIGVIGVTVALLFTSARTARELLPETVFRREIGTKVEHFDQPVAAPTFKRRTRGGREPKRRSIRSIGCAAPAVPPATPAPGVPVSPDAMYRDSARSERQHTPAQSSSPSPVASASQPNSTPPSIAYAQRANAASAPANVQAVEGLELKKRIMGRRPGAMPNQPSNRPQGAPAAAAPAPHPTGIERDNLSNFHYPSDPAASDQPRSKTTPDRYALGETKLDAQVDGAASGKPRGSIATPNFGQPNQPGAKPSSGSASVGATGSSAKAPECECRLTNGSRARRRRGPTESEACHQGNARRDRRPNDSS